MPNKWLIAWNLWPQRSRRSLFDFDFKICYRYRSRKELSAVAAGASASATASACITASAAVNVAAEFDKVVISLQVSLRSLGGL